MPSLGPNDFVVGAWFVGGDDQDWMATLWRAAGGGDVLGRHSALKTRYFYEYRFRYHVDDKIWDSEDRKSFHTISFDGRSDDEVFGKIRGAAMLLHTTGFGDYFWERRIMGGVDKFIEELRAAPFANILEQQPGPSS